MPTPGFLVRTQSTVEKKINRYSHGRLPDAK